MPLVSSLKLSQRVMLYTLKSATSNRVMLYPLLFGIITSDLSNCMLYTLVSGTINKSQIILHHLPLLEIKHRTALVGKDQSPLLLTNDSDFPLSWEDKSILTRKYTARGQI